MALTVGEASAVNTLIRFITGDPRPMSGEAVTSEQGLEAANLLAQKANKTLGAGYSGKGDVAKIWPKDTAASR